MRVLLLANSEYWLPAGCCITILRANTALDTASQPASQHPEAFVRPSGNDQIIFNLTFKGHATVCSNIIISNLSWSNRVYYTQRALDFGQYTRARVISKLRVVDSATYYQAMKCQSSTWYTPTLNRRVLNQIIVEID